MTLIVGIKCSNGVVLGADGAATLGNSAGLRTVIQPVAKLNLIKNKAIVALSGPIGLSQLYCDSVGKLCDGWREELEEDICRKLRAEFLKDAQVGLQVAALASQVVGPTAQVGIMHQTLVACTSRGQSHLIQFDYQCLPEVVTKDLPFVSIGSGQSIADPFLAFLRSIFWKDRLPTLPDGKFAVMWTLIHAIRTAPGGISKPIQMATLEIGRNNQPQAKIFEENELKEDEEAIENAEKHLSQFARNFQPTPGESGISRPPAPPA